MTRDAFESLPVGARVDYEDRRALGAGTVTEWHGIKGVAWDDGENSYHVARVLLAEMELLYGPEPQRAGQCCYWCESSREHMEVTAWIAGVAWADIICCVGGNEVD